jgi:O-acetyl-ADP-ribose deacetylase (regulator of RNase III)
MIREIDANLLEYPLDGIVHQCNCFHTMGSGIAKRIREKYPEAYKADLQQGRRGDISKLGTFSLVKAYDDKYIYNMYGQYNFGLEKRQTNYEAVYKGLYSICGHTSSYDILSLDPPRNIRLGLPKNMGCKLGGGSWIIVRAIIEEVFGAWQHDLYICNYEG